MANIPLSDLVYFNPDIPYNNTGTPFPAPLGGPSNVPSSGLSTFSAPVSGSAYLLFRVHKRPNMPKAMVIVSKTDDAEAKRLEDRFVTYIEINKQATINPNTINSNVIEGYYFYPVNEAGQTELYDIYIVPKKLLNGFQPEQLDNYIPMTGVNNYYYPILGMPTEFYLQENISNTRVSNLVGDGQFSITEINLPPVTLVDTNNEEINFKEGDIRNPITQINENCIYEVAFNQNYSVSLFGDNLSIGTFDGNPNIESNPEKYLRILATNTSPTEPWVYRDLAFYFEPYYKFDDTPFIISFWAINNNLDLTANLPISIGYQRFYGDGAAVEPRSTFTDISPFAITNIWTKYYANIDLNSNTDYAQEGNNTYVKILIRLPLTFNSFDLSITNVLINYGSNNFTYPLDYEQTYNNTITNYGTSIVNTSSGYIPLSSRAGEIKQYIHSNDTETSILADGRIIYPDDVHYYNMIDPASGKNVTFNIPYSNSYQTGLYDLIGYKYGTGNDHFTCDSLHNLTWEADATESTFDNIFYWNYAIFKPTANFTTGFGDGSVIEAIELNRGQIIDDAFTVKSFFKKDANNEIWYSANSTNYLKAAVTNGLDSYYFQNHENSVNYTNNIGVNPNLIQRVQSSSDSFKYDIRFPLEDYGINSAFPAVILNRSFEYGLNYGLIDCVKVGISEFKEYEVPVYYYQNRIGNSIPTDINGLTLITSKDQNINYGTGTSGILPNLTSQIEPQNLPILRIKHENGGFPATNPDFIIQPLQAIPGISTASNFIFNTTIIPTYSSDPLYNWQVAAGTKTSIKKIVLSLAIQGKTAFGIKLKSNVIADYYGKWFTAESKAKRTLKKITYVNNMPTVNNIEIDDNKFCFYFSNGSTPQPVDPAIPNGSKFIPIIFNNTSTKIQISQAIEKTINSYRVQIPNYQGVVLKSYGNSIFDIPNSDGSNNDVTFCNNFRNEGFGKPKMEKETMCDLTTVSVGNRNTSVALSSVINSENYMYVYNHISVC
ncbi:MAG: hypothetical protein RLZZ418_283 [Pseudomonadota bacterium]|jgi:hypothetical protein